MACLLLLSDRRRRFPICSSLSSEACSRILKSVPMQDRLGRVGVINYHNDPVLFAAKLAILKPAHMPSVLGQSVLAAYRC